MEIETIRCWDLKIGTIFLKIIYKKEWNIKKYVISIAFLHSVTLNAKNKR